MCRSTQSGGESALEQVGPSTAYDEEQRLRHERERADAEAQVCGFRAFRQYDKQPWPDCGIT